MDNIEHYKWVVESLEKSNEPGDWKQSLTTLAFMTTESYGKGLKEALLIPYLKKGLEHTHTGIQKIAIRLIVSLKTFDILNESDVDENVIAESFFEKYDGKHIEFLKPLKITFRKLMKEKKLEKFLYQIAEGCFSKDIVKELTFQLWYRDTYKMNEALDIIDFLIKKLGIKKSDFIPVLEDFVDDVDKRIYLIGKNKIKNQLKQKAVEVMGFPPEVD